MNRIAPGLYDDGEGGLHLAVGELLHAHGYPDTPTTREELARVIQEQLEPDGVPVTVTTEPIGNTPEDV
jgi:hypothetical protein